MPDQQDGLKAYEHLFRCNYQHLCISTQRITNDPDAAEDIVQEVFVRFWSNGERQAIDNPEAYLYRACINKALNYVVDQKRKTELNAQYLEHQPTAASSAEQDFQSLELQQRVQQTIENLPPMCQKVFLLSRHEEMSHKEIAEFLNISPNTVDNHIKKALSILRKIFFILFLILSQN